MSKAITTARWASAVVGGALVVALQTPPETAASNAALWIEKITGRLPDLPAWADALGTAFGVLLIVIPLALWLRKKARRRGWTDRSLAGLHRVMAGSEQASLANHARERSLRNKAEIVADVISGSRDRGSGRLEANPQNDVGRRGGSERDPQPLEWVPFHQALQYLVYETRWSASQPPVATEEEFNGVVSAEVRERVARGDIATRGQLGWNEESRNRATQPIPAKYWIEAFFLPYSSIALGASGGDEIAKQGGGGDVYRSVILRWPDVQRTWIRSVPLTAPLTPLACFVDSARAKIAAEGAQPSSRGLLAALDDELAEQKERTFQQLASVLSSDRARKVRSGEYRNVTLAEALGWVVNGEWGAPWHGTPFSAALGSALGVGSNIYELLTDFSKRAQDGKLTVWGKPTNSDVWQSIPPSHWGDHQLTLADTFGGVTTGEGGYRDLMLNRSEVEVQWPHEG